VSYINSLPDDVLKSAELALFCKKFEEAIGILISNKRIYRAIKMCIRMHRWDQALELAVQNKTHIDTVLAYREQFLKSMRHTESKERFLELANEVTWDWDTVKSKIASEKEKERAGTAM
jgi:intraflagellar transport protein 80